MAVRSRGALLTTTVAGSALVLRFVAPPAIVAARLTDPAGAAQQFGPESVAVAAAAAVCWVALGWLACVLAVTAVAAAPGRAGQVAAVIATRTVPAGLRQMLALGLGAAVVTGTAGPALADAAPTAPGPAAAATAPDLDWPIRPAGGRQTPLPAGRPPTAGKPGPPASQPVHARPTAALTPPPAVVVVRGDSLWSIARDHLPAGAANAEIATAWPRWYAANRDVVGVTPDVLLPGQRLVAPTPLPGGPS